MKKGSGNSAPYCQIPIVKYSALPAQKLRSEYF
jgi:hypothetical protein